MTTMLRKRSGRRRPVKPNVALKNCRRCGKVLEPTVGEWPSEYKKRTFCSLACSSRNANDHRNGKPPVHAGSVGHRRPDLTWQERAACRTDDPKQHHNFDGSGDDRAAKRICAACPVIAACLKQGIVGNEYGIWGGTTEAERAEMRKKGQR